VLIADCKTLHITLYGGNIPIFFVVLGFELRAFTLSHSTSPIFFFFFVMGIFEIGSHELVAWDDFKSQSSWSLPPEYLGLQIWATGPAIPFFFFLRCSLTGWKFKILLPQSPKCWDYRCALLHPAVTLIFMRREMVLLRSLRQGCDFWEKFPHTPRRH
jgi:hypothetical protein